MTLTRNVKESTKTALAMTIAYSIALSMDWERPYWAGFAVAFISLATTGQSFNKAAMRMMGTLMAFVVALTLIALYAQDRWLFILSLSIWVGFCTYMMGGAKNQYFWNVGGFVCVIISLDAGPNSINAFQTAVLRVQETGLGILVYSLIAVLLWPRNIRVDFDEATRKLAITQHKIYQTYFNLMSDCGNAKEAKILSAQEDQELSWFNQHLVAAATDNYEIWELRHQWRRYQNQITDLTETMERWRESFAEVKALDLQSLLPDLTDVDDELNMRLTQLSRMLEGKAPERLPKLVELSLDKDSVKKLSHFHKAALAITHSRLQRLEHLTRTLFDTVCVIKGFSKVRKSVAESRARDIGFMPDVERLASAIQVMASLWLAFLAWIYVPDIPGGTGFVTMTGVLGMAIASMPQISVLMLIVPSAASISFAGILYILVMPQMSSFMGLGVMIFVATFIICYLFATPRQALGRTLGLAMFVTIISINNEQSYYFLSVADTALMFPLVFLIVAITANIPFSPKPEKAFQRLLARFFCSSEYLVSTIHSESAQTPGYLAHWKKTFHIRELATLPVKLKTWTPHINTQVLQDTKPEQIQALITSLIALNMRMQDLLEARSNPQLEFLVQELHGDIRSWQLKMQDSFQRLSKEPAAGNKEVFNSKLMEIMQQLEQRIKEALNKSTGGQFSDQDGENFYRLLGAYRGVSEALIAYAGNASVIDWERWSEGRF